MADGFNITGGFDDLDLTSDFLDGTVKGVILDFADKLQKDLLDSIDRKGHVTSASILRQMIAASPNVVELDNMIVYTLTYPEYGDYLDKGVNGIKQSHNSPFSFKTENTGGIRQALTRYAKLKTALGITSEKEAKRFGYLAARKKKIFGMKPTYWLSDILNDGRFDSLEEELGKNIALMIVTKDAKTASKIKKV